MQPLFEKLFKYLALACVALVVAYFVWGLSEEYLPWTYYTPQQPKLTTTPGAITPKLIGYYTPKIRRGKEVDVNNLDVINNEIVFELQEHSGRGEFSTYYKPKRVYIDPATGTLRTQDGATDWIIDKANPSKKHAFGTNWEIPVNTDFENYHPLEGEEVINSADHLFVIQTRFFTDSKKQKKVEATNPVPYRECDSGEDRERTTLTAYPRDNSGKLFTLTMETCLVGFIEDHNQYIYLVTDRGSMMKFSLK